MFTLAYSKILVILWKLNLGQLTSRERKRLNFQFVFFNTFAMVFIVGFFTSTLYAQNGPSGSYTEASLDDSLIRNAVGNVLRLLEGAFGALIMVVAGILAIISAAMGGYRNAVSLLVVALGAFILRALISLFFGTDFEAFQN